MIGAAPVDPITRLPHAKANFKQLQATSAGHATPVLPCRFYVNFPRSLRRPPRLGNRQSICKKCGQPKTDEAWTRVDLATMAQKADVNLAVLYGWCYLEPTFHSHATGFGLSRRLRRNDDD